MRPGSSRAPAAGSYGAGRPQSAAGSINAAPTIHGRYSSKHLPYALVDFDKQQVFINSVSGTPENPLWAGGNTQYKFDVSRVTDLTVSLYIRNPSAPPNAGRNEDIFIGTLRINPRFEEQRQDDKARKGEATAAGQAGADWVDIQFGSGSMKVGVNFVENRQDRLAIDDFELLKVVGKGSFGKVMQVQYVAPPVIDHQLSTHTLQKEGHAPHLRPQDHPQSPHHLSIRSRAYPGRAIGSRTDQQPLHCSAQILVPVT
jgi:serum/glucocorticoid-regulated kinase 2